jgi:hypothetical protein
MRESFRRATAYHEAGHAVIACRSRIKLRSVTIVPGNGYSGRVEHVSPLRGIHLDVDGSNKARMKAEAAIIVSLAGPAAQRRYNPRSLRAWHSSSDYELASGLALRLNRDEESAAAYLKWLGMVARQSVEAQWRFIEKLAGALLDRESLSGSEILAVLMSSPMKGAYSSPVHEGGENREQSTVEM